MDETAKNKLTEQIQKFLLEPLPLEEKKKLITCLTETAAVTDMTELPALEKEFQNIVKASTLRRLVLMSNPYRTTILLMLLIKYFFKLSMDCFFLCTFWCVRHVVFFNTFVRRFSQVSNNETRARTYTGSQDQFFDVGFFLLFLFGFFLSLFCFFSWFGFCFCSRTTAHVIAGAIGPRIPRIV